MTKGDKNKISRKEFLESIGRISIMGVLVFIPAYLISNKRLSGNPSVCDLEIQCSNCGEKSNCDLIKEN